MSFVQSKTFWFGAALSVAFLYALWIAEHLSDTRLALHFGILAGLLVVTGVAMLPLANRFHVQFDRGGGPLTLGLIAIPTGIVCFVTKSMVLDADLRLLECGVAVAVFFFSVLVLCLAGIDKRSGYFNA